MVGIVQLKTPEGRVKQIQCYVFDSPLGPTQKMLLLSLQSVIEASINIIHHMDLSIKGKRGPLRFWPDNKSLEQICREISSIDLKPTLHRRVKHQETYSRNGKSSTSMKLRTVLNGNRWPRNRTWSTWQYSTWKLPT